MVEENRLVELKSVIRDTIDLYAEDLYKLSDDIWQHPELGHEEVRAHDTLTKFLKDHGFQTAGRPTVEIRDERIEFLSNICSKANSKDSDDSYRSSFISNTESSYKLKTAFRACYGSKEAGPNIAFLSEYDALPGIGHACGHNLIAEVGVAAALGLMAAMKKAQSPLGMVTVLGTPAEEGQGGKIDLIDAGAFDDIDVAMMAHPFPDNDITPIYLARESLEVTYTGRPSHAAGFPWEGVNALDGAVATYQALACLRQHIKPDCRIHCIFTEGGVKVNIIPEKAVLHVALRAPTDGDLATLKQKVVQCFKSGAVASGCEVSWKLLNKPYSSVMHNKPLAQLYEANIQPLLPSGCPTLRSAICASTDMGNVSHVVPSIHPNFHIGGSEVNHTRGFTKDAGNPRAQRYTLIQAKSLAMTALDIMMDTSKMATVKDSFNQSLNQGITQA